MVKSTLIPGKFFSFLFGVLFGIILVVGGVVGVGFYAYKKVPASKVLSLIPGEEEWLSATYAEKTAEQLIKEFSTLKADTLTLSKLAEISPALDEKLTDLLDKVGDTGIVAIDKDVLYQTPVTSLAGELKNVLIISASLNSLGEKLGFSLPDMPLIKGGTEGNEVWVYTAVNDNADKKIEKAIEKGEYAYYTKSSEYSETPVTTLTSYDTYTIENVDDNSGEYLKTSSGNFIYLKVNETAYEKIKSDDKNIVSKSPYTFKTPDLYTKNDLDSTEEYSKITSDPTGTVDLYEVPVKYAYEHLFAKVGEDFVQATNEDFSVKDEYKNVHLYSKVDVYTQVATEDMTDQFKQDNVLYVKSNGIGSLPITVGISALSKALDMNALSLNQVGEYFGVTLENDLLSDVMDVPFANLSESMNSIINNMALADVINLNSESSPILLYIAYGVEGVDYNVDGTQIIPIFPPRSINEVMDCIDNLRIGHIIPAESGSHGLIEAIQDWSLDDFNNPDKIKSLKLSEVIEIDVGSKDTPQILKAIKDCPVGGLSDAISTLTIEDMMGKVDESETILFAIKDCTIDTLSPTIQNLSLQDLFADQVYRHHLLTSSEKLLLNSMSTAVPLYVWGTGEYVAYNPLEHGELTDPDLELYIDYTIGYDGTDTLPDLTADKYTNEAYKKVHLFAWENVEGTFKYVDASEITGWALPDGYSDSKTYYYKDNDVYIESDSPVYDDEINKYIYNNPVLYYLDENENVQKVKLLPEHLGIKAGYENKVLFTKMFIAESDSNHEYDFANLYYYDIEAQAYKRVEATYERTIKDSEDDSKKTYKFSVGAEYQGKTLFTHGDPVGIWKYLLMHPDDGYETIGSINKIGEQVSHACSNINKATIKELYDDGLITISGDATVLGKEIDHDWDLGVHTENKALSSLTISEMLNYIISAPDN